MLTAAREADSASFQALATSVNTAAAMGAHAISNSYGGGESGSSTFEPFYNYAGIAVTVSSGDSGFGVEFPASSSTRNRGGWDESRPQHQLPRLERNSLEWSRQRMQHRLCQTHLAD